MKLDPALQVAASELSWDELPALPPWGAQVAQPRVTSPLVGVHAGALVVAGGAKGRGLGASVTVQIAAEARVWSECEHARRRDQKC